MLSARYLQSTKNLDAVLDKIVGGVAPDKFTIEHLRGLGFTSSLDRSYIPVLKDLGFLTAEGAPTPRYQAYRDRSKSKAVMADALREAYSDVFHINEKLTASDRPAVEGLFKSKLNSTDRVAQLQAKTFFALLSRADLSARVTGASVPTQIQRGTSADDAKDGNEREPNSEKGESTEGVSRSTVSAELHYTIQVHLPATKDLEVYNAIFRSLRENLLS